MPRAWVSRAAQGEHALQHFLELQHLVRLAHAAGGEAGELLADHAGLARLLDLVAQGAQAGAVDLAGGGEDVDPLERRGQRRRDLRAELGHELVPALVVAAAGTGRSDGSRGTERGLRAWQAIGNVLGARIRRGRASQSDARGGGAGRAVSNGSRSPGVSARDRHGARPRPDGAAIGHRKSAKCDNLFTVSVPRPCRSRIDRSRRSERACPPQGGDRRRRRGRTRPGPRRCRRPAAAAPGR